MKYCARCLYPANHPLHLTFDEEGVCSGCRIHEEKDALDWNERSEHLKEIFEEYRNRSQSNYDCIVPVSGARDSYFIVHTVKNIYGMNPLLVTYNKHHNTKAGIQNISRLRTLLDCDIVTLTLDPALVKKLTHYTLKKMGSMYWHCLAGQTVFPVRCAVGYKVPLIIWGAHQGCDQVGMFSHLDEVEMSRKYRKEHDLMGHEAEDLISAADGISEKDVEPLKYPHDKEIEAVGVRGIYLSNYIRWDSKKQHEAMLERYGYHTMEQQRTFDTYNDVDCAHYSGVHDYIKFLKYGYGKVTDHASREIRLKRLTREEGISLVDQYSNIAPSDLKQFLGWIEVSEKDFYECIDRHRDSAIWEKKDGRWHLKDSVQKHIQGEGVAEARLNKTEECRFKANTPSAEGGYQLLTRGFCAT